MISNYRVFGTNKTMQRLCNNDRVYMDGTFKAAHALFAQLYSLFGILGHRNSFSDKWDSDYWDSDKWGRTMK